MRKTLLRIGVVVLVLLLGLTAGDAFTRLFMSRSVTFTTSTKGKPQLVVLFHGLMGQNATVSLAPLKRYYEEKDWDTITVSTGDVYDPDNVAVETAKIVAAAEAKTHYRRIVFDGTSLGGRAAVDTRLVLKDQYPAFEKQSPAIDLLLEGAPLTWRSILGVQQYGAWLAGRCLCGKIANIIPAPELAFQPPRPINIEVGVTRQELDRAVAAAKSTTSAQWSSQMGSIVERDAYQDGTLNGLFRAVTFMWFDMDHDTVDQSVAVDEWKRAFQGHQVNIVHVRSTHTGYAEAPIANADAHDKALKLAK